MAYQPVSSHSDGDNEDMEAALALHREINNIPDSISDEALQRSHANRVVQHNVAANLQDAREQSPTYLCVAFTFFTAELVATSVILGMHWFSPCDQPLRWFVLLYSSRLLLHMPVFVARYRAIREGRPVEDLESLRQRLQCVELLAFVLFIVGQVWLFSSDTCVNTAPALYYYAFTLVALVYVSIVLPLVLFLLLCFCLPCVLAVLEWLNDPHVRQSTPEDVLERLHTRAWDRDPEEERRKGVDPDGCAICLNDYEVGVEVMQLPCRHEFHSECISKWLRTSRDCPFCRRDVTIAGGAEEEV